MEMNIASEALHTLSQALTIPVIVVLILLIAYSVCAIGSVIVEYVAERRHFKFDASGFIHAIEDAAAAQVEHVISTSGLLKNQRSVLSVIWGSRALPTEALWSLSKELLAESSQRDRNAVTRVETVAKIAPMIGLLGTLIPLGPGIVALSSGDTATLAGALLIAFDTTVAGLVVAAVCTVLVRIRRSWYARYQAAMEAAVNTELEKIACLGLSRGDNAAK